MYRYSFFEEFTRPAGGASTGNVIAVPAAPRSFVQPGGICLPVVCADEDHSEPNSPVAPSFLLAEYLGTHCRKISEEQARRMHPRLFEYLDNVC